MTRHRARWMILALIVALVALGGSTLPGLAAPAISLSLWSGFPEIMPVYQRVAADYERAHPDVKVTILVTQLRDYERKLAASIPSDTAGDILELAESTMDRYIEAGLIPKAPSDIAQFVRSRSFGSASQDHAAFRGDVYGVPWFMGVGAIFYNSAMFKDAGISKPPQTMDELMADAKKLTKYDAQSRVTRSGISLRLFGAGSGVAEKFAILMWPSGGEILTETASGKYKAGYDNEAGQATLTLHIDALYRDKVDSFDLKHDAEAFELGQAAMFERESWVVGDIKQHAPSLQYMAAPMPRAKRWGTIFNPVNLYVSRSAKNPNAAWEFVKFLMQPQYQRQLLEQVGWLPQRQDVNYDPVFAKIPQYRAFLVKDKNYVYWSMPAIRDFDEIETKLADRLVAAYRDRSLLGNPSGIAKVLHDAAEETNNILKRDGLYGP